MKEKQTFCCTDNLVLLPISGSFVVLLGASLIILYFVTGGVTSSVYLVEGAVPTYVVALIFIISGLVVALLYATSNRVLVSLAVTLSILCVILSFVQVTIILATSIPFLEEARCIHFPGTAQCQCHLVSARAHNASTIFSKGDSDPYIFQNVSSTCDSLENTLKDFLVIFCIIYCFGAVACVFTCTLSCLVLCETRQHETQQDVSSTARANKRVPENQSHAETNWDAIDVENQSSHGAQQGAVANIASESGESSEPNRPDQRTAANKANRNSSRPQRVQRSLSITSGQRGSTEGRLTRHHSVATADTSPSHNPNRSEATTQQNQAANNHQQRNRDSTSTRPRVPPLLVQGGYLQGQVNGPTIPVYTVHGTNEAYISLTDLPSLHMQIPSLQSLPAYIPELPTPLPEEEPPPYTPIEVRDYPGNSLFGQDNIGFVNEGGTTVSGVRVDEIPSDTQNPASSQNDQETGNQIESLSRTIPAPSSYPNSTSNGAALPGHSEASHEDHNQGTIVETIWDDAPTLIEQSSAPVCQSTSNSTNEVIAALSPTPQQENSTGNSQTINQLNGARKDHEHAKTKRRLSKVPESTSPKHSVPKQSDLAKDKESKRRKEKDTGDVSKNSSSQNKYSRTEKSLKQPNTLSENKRKTDRNKDLVLKGNADQFQKQRRKVPETLPKIRNKSPNIFSAETSTARKEPPNKVSEQSWLKKGAKPKRRFSVENTEDLHRREYKKKDGARTEKRATVSRSSQIGAAVGSSCSVDPPRGHDVRFKPSSKASESNSHNRNPSRSTQEKNDHRQRSRSPSKRNADDRSKSTSESHRRTSKTEACSSDSLSDLVNFLESARDASVRPKTDVKNRQKRKNNTLKQDLRDSKI